ncbi:MAG TPA: DUF4214 domain-containing protein [Iamia sp.]|nr:DUF4214 domain-containing protein [Iamia sp.]
MPVKRARPLLAAVLGLALLVGSVVGSAPAGAIPVAPDIKGVIGYDVEGGTGYHRVIWGHGNDGANGGAIDAWQVQRWTLEDVLVQTYDVTFAQGPDLTVGNMPDEVGYKYRVRAHNSQGWSGYSGFEAIAVDSFFFHWEPYGSETNIVRGHYRNFLDRLPTASESSTATSQITNAGTLVSFLNGLINQTARTKNRYPVIRLYLAYFDRAPEPGGLSYWVGRLNAGTATLTSVSSFFASSAEFDEIYGDTTNQEFVTLVYQNVLDRNPAPNEVAYWKGQLDQGKTTRGKVMTGFSESAEGKTHARGEATVADVWTAMMDEQPTNSLMQTYGDHIRAGGTGGDIALFLQHLNDYPVD